MIKTRRQIITGLGATLGAGLGSLSLSACAPAPGKLTTGASSSASKGLEYLFPLGVASGDPNSDGFVIWTRLAPEPMSETGGMNGPVSVTWQVAEDELFAKVIRAGITTATSDWAHSVHVEVSGLLPLRPYYYRFIAHGQTSPVGRSKTTPLYGANVDHLRFGIASCQHWEQGFFNAYNDMVAQDPDLIIHLGDYIYEASWGPQVRRQATTDAVSLTDYRRIHAQYKTDPALQAAHAHAPWLFIWDDHEFVNDYANLEDENYMPLEQVRTRRAAAYKAYYEHMPVRLRSQPKGEHMRLYDYFYYGNLMTMALTDGRQYRDDQACQTDTDGGGRPVARETCPQFDDPKRSMFGKEQERWLMPSFARSGAQWEVLAQPTLFSRLFQKTREGTPAAWNDGWDGYPAARNMLLKAVEQRQPKNFISIGGDMHSWWQADLKADYNDPNSKVLGSEFVTTSVTAHSYNYNNFQRMLPDNPHINFVDDRKRGYSLVDLTPDKWLLQMKETTSVYDPKAGAETVRAYVVENGIPGSNLTNVLKAE